MAAFQPVQVITGVPLASHHGVTWQSIAKLGYDRTLTAKLALFVFAMMASSVH